MDSKIKAIYLYMVDIDKHWPWGRSSKEVRAELKADGINPTEIWDNITSELTGRKWGYEQRIYIASKLIKKIKKNLVITDEIIAAEKVLSYLFKDPFEGNDIVPFRDRKHTRGAFRRADDG